MFRTIDTAMWTDPKIRPLPPDGKLLFVYLVTNSHSHVSGIYYLPTHLMAHETGIKEARINTLLDTLSGAELVCLDRVLEVVWVKKMLDRQGLGRQNNISASKQLHTLHNCSLVKDFLQFYAHREIPYQIPYSIPPRALARQDQDQDQDIVSSNEDTCDQAKPDRQRPSKIYFPVRGHSQWFLPQKRLDRFLAEYADRLNETEIISEFRKAYRWLQENPAKRKTIGGMSAFLTRWLNKTWDAKAKVQPNSRAAEIPAGAVYNSETGGYEVPLEVRIAQKI